MLTPHAFCLSTPVLQCLVLPGSSTGSAALQGGPSKSPGQSQHRPGTVPQHINTKGRKRHWKQGPSRHSSREQMETRLELRLQHEAEGLELSNRLPAMRFQGPARETGMDRQTDRSSTAPEGTRGSGLSFNGAPGPVGRGCVGGGPK